MTSPAETSLVKEGDLLVGKYRVERVLGVGGMGVVVAATHVDLDQRVALKFLLPELTQNAEAVERFLREARSAVKLRSDHVAKVLDVGKLETGAPYIVMEYLEGSDLATVIEQKRPPIDIAVEYMLQTCEAIAEAHHLGIVHRDLKPQNLFVTKRVHGAALLKVLDFGISKAVTPAGVRDMTLTKTGIVMGSPLYMSPEQMKSGRLADHRSDLWALGVILYELLTGTQPFQAETVPHLCAMIMTEQPRPPRELNPKIPLGLQAVVLHCLEKDPNKRYQNVAEFAGALEPFAPSSARGATGRISNVLNVSGVMIEMTNAPTEPKESIAGAASASTAVQSSTSVEWSESKQATTIRLVQKPLALWLGGAGALLVVGVVVVALTHGGSHGASTAPGSGNDGPAATVTVKTTPTETTPTPTETPTTMATPTPTPAPAIETAKPTASGIATSTSKTKPPIVSTKPPTVSTKPTSTASTKPTTAKPPGPDLFGDPQ